MRITLGQCNRDSSSTNLVLLLKILTSLSELKQRELTLKEECAYKDSLKTLFEEEQRRIHAQAESIITQKENKMQLDFDEKYQSKFDVMQAELKNQFALLQAERDRMKSEWDSCMNDKDLEINNLKIRLQSALDKTNT